MGGKRYDLVHDCRSLDWCGSRCHHQNMGCFFKMFAGLIGSTIGQSLLGYWGPSLAGMALIPSIVGAIIVIAVVEFFFGKNR